MLGIATIVGGLGIVGFAALGAVALIPLFVATILLWRRRRRWRPVHQGTTPLLLLDDLER